MDNGIIVIHCLIQSDLVSHIHRLRPSSPADEKRQAVNAEFGISVNFRASVKQVLETDITSRIARFIQTHGPHGQPCEPSRTGVCDLFSIRGHSGAGQHKLSQLSTVVNLKADGIPQLRCKLPFVDQSRRCTFQQSLGVEFRHGNILFFPFGVIHIEDAGGKLLGGGGLSTPLRPLDQNRTFSLQLPFQYIVSNSLSVFFHSEPSFPFVVSV